LVYADRVAFRSERAMARGLMRPGEFVEVFVDAPLSPAWWIILSAAES
jgi:adenylylsulfate kinase-like enzyme